VPKSLSNRSLKHLMTKVPCHVLKVAPLELGQVGETKDEGDGVEEDGAELDDGMSRVDDASGVVRVTRSLQMDWRLRNLRTS
jgi:hypothetical protein